MTQTIHVLPDHVANQIAAGEVIQRPASVVKELMENAVDAGASQVEVHVLDAGRTSIQVMDNGAGMSAEDARVCFTRHATSKLSTAEDLFALATKGFRGEALASIAAIAQVEVHSCQAETEVGVPSVAMARRWFQKSPKPGQWARHSTSRTSFTMCLPVVIFSSRTPWSCGMWWMNSNGWHLPIRMWRLC